MKYRIRSAAILLLSFAVSLGVLSTLKPGKASLPDRSALFMYLIMPDRFDDADSRNNSANGVTDPSNPKMVQGGDLRGIERRLGYLHALGINAIWVTPVQKNVPGAFHGYWIQDFLSVDPRLGTMEDLRSLISKAHDFGMRVYLDIVCNHTGPLSEPAGGEWKWKDEGYTLTWRDSSMLPLPSELQNLSLYHNFGEVKQWADPWQVLGELPGGLDDLKTEDPRVLDILVNIWKWWMEQTGCDGYRVDTVKHVDMQFWYDFLEALRRHAIQIGKTEFFIFGEVYSGEDVICAPYTKPDALGRPGFDAVFNFSLAEALRDVFGRGAPVGKLAASINNLKLYHPDSRPFLMTFIDNHDLPRFMHVSGGDFRAMHLALKCLYFAEGIPVLYYGTEHDFLGGEPDHENRESMFAGGWKGRNPPGDSFAASGETFRFIQTLIAVRARNPVLQAGSSSVTYMNEERGILVLQRTLNGRSAFALINRGDGPAGVDLRCSHSVYQWPDGGEYRPSKSGILKLRCDPDDVAIFLPR